MRRVGPAAPAGPADPVDGGRGAVRPAGGLHLLRGPADLPLDGLGRAPVGGRGGRAQTETTVLLPGEGDQAHVYEYTLTPQEGVAVYGDAQESGWEGSVYVDEGSVQIQLK